MSERVLLLMTFSDGEHLFFIYDGWEDYMNCGYPYLAEKIRGNEISYWLTAIICQDEYVEGKRDE